LPLFQADLQPDIFDSLLKLREVVLQPQLLVFNDANEFDELVILLFLLADVFLAG
jgi:hypothetical protein